MPEKYIRNVKSFKRMGYSVKVWTSPLENMINRDVFDAMRTYAGKADIMRLEILYQFGGIYTDADSRIFKRLPEPKNGLICMKTPNGFIGNETIVSKKGHEALKEAIEGIKDHIKTLKRCNIWDIAGATYLTPIFEKYEPLILNRNMIGSSHTNPKFILHQYDASWSNGISKSAKMPLNYWLDEKLLT
jgi:mannosyltransferase OCH1-like enzyme